MSNLSTGVWIALALLAIALVLALAAVGVLWRRTRQIKGPVPAPARAPDVAQLQKPMFAAAMAALYPRDADYRYDKPCVLVCGALGAGKSDLLRGAGLAPLEVLGGKDSGWWRGTEGAAFELPAAAWEAEGHAWIDFLRLLDRHRPRRALDALVWVIPFTALEAGRADGERMYRKFVDIQDRLGLRLPVYVIVSGMDAADGFAGWAARLPEAARAQPLGWSNPNALGTVWRAQDGEQGVARVLQRLRRLVSAISARRDLAQDAPAIFTLPERIGAALAQLPRALQEAMRQNAVMTPFELRGFYLTGRCVAGTGAGAGVTAPPDPFGLAAAPPAAPPPVFCRELFAQRVFGEFGLAALVQRRLNAERRSQLLTLGGASLLALIWLVALVPTYYATRTQFEQIRRPLLMVQNALQQRGGAAQIDERSTIELLTEMDKVPDWSTPTVALPLSWGACCGGLRAELNQMLTAYFSTVLFRHIDHALGERARSLGALHANTSSGAAALAPDPAQPGQYKALQEFLDGVLEYEYQHHKFSDIAGQDSGSWKATVGLLDYLFGIKLNSSSPATMQRFDMLLRDSTYHLAPDQASKDEKLFSARLTQLHGDWIARLFSDSRLLPLQRTLLKGVLGLSSGSGEAQADLAGLQHAIGELRGLLTQTNAVWLADGDLVNSDAYRKVDGKIRKSHRLGEALADQLKINAELRQHEFRQEVVEESRAKLVLAYTQGKQLLVNPELAELEQALGLLLQHRFTQGASGGAAHKPDADTPLRWNADQLALAQEVLADLAAYETVELVKAPVAYQPTLRQLARLQAGALLDHELAAAAVPAQCDAAWQCANFEEARKPMAQLLATMRKLELATQAQSWENLMDHQAEALLRELTRVAESSALYLPDAAAVASWDGVRAGALQGYGMRATAGMQDYLDNQLQLVGRLALASKAPRAWLAQDGAAGARDVQRLLADWQRIDDELLKQATKVPAGSLRRLEVWLTEELVLLESATCVDRLSRAAPPDPDFFQRRLARVASTYRPQCLALEAQAMRAGYNAIAGHFNGKLLGRFPFAPARGAAAAEPADVRRLLQLLDIHLLTLHTALARLKDPQSSAALAFVDRLAAAQPMLAALLAEDPAGGYAALDVWPQFRINRTREKGAEQIIEWSVATGDVLPPPAPGGAPGVAWRMDQPISMTLRWAKNSPVAPVATSARPEMEINERAAQWTYRAPWALLRLLTEHAAPQSELAESDVRPPVALRLAVPTQDLKGNATGEAVAYARLAVAPHGKPERLALPVFPSSAAPPLRADGIRMAGIHASAGEPREATP